MKKYESPLIKNDDIKVYIRKSKYICKVRIHGVDVIHISSGLRSYGEHKSQVEAYNKALIEIEKTLRFYMIKYDVDLEKAIESIREEINCYGKIQ